MKYREKLHVEGVNEVANKFAGDVMDLCIEVERLQQIADERNSEYTDFTLMPFGGYIGVKLMDIPDDYLAWLQRTTNREGVLLETRYGPYAKREHASRKLRLLDYIKRRQEYAEASKKE